MAIVEKLLSLRNVPVALHTEFQNLSPNIVAKVSSADTSNEPPEGRSIYMLQNQK